MFLFNSPKENTAGVNMNMLATVHGHVVPFDAQLRHVHEQSPGNSLTQGFHVATRLNLNPCKYSTLKQTFLILST